MTTRPDNRDDLIDSREVIAAIEELEAEREALADAVEEAQAAYDFHNSEDTKTGPEWEDLTEAIDRLAEWDESSEAEELANLQALASEGEDYAPDWLHGATLIRKDYFYSNYAEELCKDVGAIPSDVPDYIVIDWEATAENLSVDYTEVDFDGETYLIR
jgi:DNA repair exonuclease SbcCD ATPase subunit